MARLFLLVVLFFCAVAAASAIAENRYPVVGVLDQATGGAFAALGSSYIAASYVKYLESAGARVVPVRFASTDAELAATVGALNGLLLPGGGAVFGGQYWRALSLLFGAALRMNDAGTHFPVWGTCLGFEELLCLAGNDTACLDGGFDSEDLALPLELTPAAKQSRIVASMPERALGVVTTQNATYNNHQSGITVEHFRESAKISGFFDLLSTNRDKKGKEFASLIEAKKYPIWGSQFHPEKAMFEWNKQNQVDHSTDSVYANQWFAQFFVSECRKNNNAFPTEAKEKEHLIYNYSPKYTGDISESFVQCYFFP